MKSYSEFYEKYADEANNIFCSTFAKSRRTLWFAGHCQDNSQQYGYYHKSKCLLVYRDQILECKHCNFKSSLLEKLDWTFVGRTRIPLVVWLWVIYLYYSNCKRPIILTQIAKETGINVKTIRRIVTLIKCISDQHVLRLACYLHNKTTRQIKCQKENYLSLGKKGRPKKHLYYL